MKNKNITSLVIIIIFFATLIFLLHSNKATEKLEKQNAEDTHSVIQYVKIAGKNIKVELALTDTEHAQGLSGRAGLKAGEGLLFVFERSDTYSFWMKDMNFSIDIIWLDENKQVVYIKENATPESYPESYKPETKAKYVLEVVSGFSQKNNLKVGDRVEFTY